MLYKRQQMKVHFQEFMKNMRNREHVEVAPPLQQGQEYWSLPLFGVYYLRKLDKIQMFFDSSTPYEGL